MKSIVKKTLYTGLGILGAGKDAIENLGKDLAKKAKVSEQEGEILAKQLEAKSRKAIASIRKTVDAEVTTVAATIHSALQDDVVKIKARNAALKPKAAPARKAAAKTTMKTATKMDKKK